MAIDLQPTKRALLWGLNTSLTTDADAAAADHADTVRIGQYLSAGGFEVKSVSEPHRVEVELAGTPGYDLVLVETGRGLLERDAAIARIRESTGVRSIPFLFVSVDGFTQAQVRRDLALGVDDCIRLSQVGDQEGFLARVAALVRRPHVPRDLLLVEPATGLFAHRVLESELGFCRRLIGAGRTSALFVVIVQEADDQLLGVTEHREMVGVVAQILRNSVIAPEAIVFATRQFCFLLSGPSMSGIVEQAKELLGELNGTQIQLELRSIRITCAGGLAKLEPDQTNAELEREALGNALRNQLRPAGDPTHVELPDTTPTELTTQKIILLVTLSGRHEDELVRSLVARGVCVVEVCNLVQARSRLSHFVPDALLLACPCLTEEIEEFLDYVADNFAGRVPTMHIAAHGTFESESEEEYARGLDQVVTDLNEPETVAAFVSALLDRPPLAGTDQPVGEQPPSVGGRPGAELAGHRRTRLGPRGYLAVVYVPGLSASADTVGNRGVEQLRAQLVGLIETMAQGRITMISAATDMVVVSLPGLSSREVAYFSRRLSQEIMRTVFQCDDERFRLTPAIGFCATGAKADASSAQDMAIEAALTAATNLDLQPLDFSYVQKVTRRAEKSATTSPLSPRSRLRQLLEGLGPLVLCILFPFLIYVWAFDAGFNLVALVYPVVVVALVGTAGSIILEGLLALRPTVPPPPEKYSAAGEYPKASALVAAYLPNEASTVVATVENLLNNDYPNLEVVLAYNTPTSLPIEVILEELAERDDRLKLLRVKHSTSKAQNVNAALEIVEGEFVGIFDADHRPARGSFRRAWQWLDGGYDVVQGHSVIRNGSVNWVTRMVAVEFEAIYAVSHPGRTRLHGFGLFGGSNGYWRTELLRQTRMQGSMLTEDIDSSFRVTEAGHRIATDPGLLSTELAPTSIHTLWDQRMRWAQGWFQVTLKHMWSMELARTLTARQRVGAFMLLPFRELYLWISLQIFPILAFSIYQVGFGNVDWIVPVFLLATLFTVSVGPAQTVFAYRLADQRIKKHRRWFWSYLALSTPWYTEFKNQISRTAQAKEVLRDRHWKITPRD